MSFRVIPELWFVAYNLVLSKYRACCYLCAWWSDGTENVNEAQRWLDNHVVTNEHAALEGEVEW